MERFRIVLVLILGAFLLAACESDEEKAEGYYQSGLALLEEGEVERALIEFRNVFNHNGFHKEARQIYADTLLDMGNTQDAYSQYLRLIEQYPDEVAVRHTLAELALGNGNWNEVERHGRAVLQLAPDDVRSKAIETALAYRQSVLDDDFEAQASAFEAARAVLEEKPDSIPALRVVIDAQVRSRTPTVALPDLEKGIALDPDYFEFWLIKFRILSRADEADAAQETLEQMYAQFPENEEVRNTLVQWYMSRRDFESAEAFLRELAGPDDGPTRGHMTVVQFLRRAQGTDVAKAELDRLVAANGSGNAANLYRAMSASIDFESGASDTAIADMQEIIANAEPSGETRQIKNILARMLKRTDNPVGARALVEEVLAEDTSNVDALKMRAEFLITEDRPEAAITDLRAALGQSPRDPEILTLMADAHERAGSNELAGERLALAVDVSNAAPAESIRYAQFLVRSERIQAAESILQDARRANPTNLSVLEAITRFWIDQRDWTSVEIAIIDIEEINTEPALALAARLRTASLIGQNRTDDVLALLEDQIASGDDSIRPTVTMIMTQIRGGRADDARSTLETALSANPRNRELRTLEGALLQLEGNIPEAELALRLLIADHPDAAQPVRMLYSILNNDGRPDEAIAVIDAGIEAQPGNQIFLWIKGGDLEKKGDIDGAIDVYEQMYALSSDNLIVANNLASLLATHRDDDESLDRAFAVARRLRNEEFPAFQDTYGWIESRRGNHEEALPYLQSAAAGLPDDPLVQFHLGMTHAALGQIAEAREVLMRALEIAGDSDLPQFETARQTLAGFEESPETE